MTRSTGAVRPRVLALLTASTLVLSACGTRMSKSEIAAHNPGRANSAATVNGIVSGNVVGGGQVQGGSGVTGGGVTGGGAVSGGTLDSGGFSGGGAVASGGGAAAGGGGGGTVGSGSTGGGAVAGGADVTDAGNAGGSEGGAGHSTAGGAPCTSQGEPIVIGQGGAFSGVIGQATGDIKLGMSVWTKWVNDNGGIQCHPVVLYQADDGSDPSKSAANVNDFVKNKHAVALVGMNIPVTTPSANNVAKQLGVPIIGADLADLSWFSDPNLFPTGSFSLASWGGGMVQAAATTGHKKLGLLYCVEATICQDIHKNLVPMTRAAKPDIVMQQAISLTQTDFTAECQNAKNAGVQILMAYMDGAAIQRVARSCKSIGFKPVLETGDLAISSTVLQDPNIREMNLYVGNNNANFISTGTPALDTLHAAFEKYTGRDIPDQPAMKGWAAGMLFKAAIDKLGAAARQGPITSAMVYEGLYKLRNETLGGLTPPLNFIKGKAAPMVTCYATFAVTMSGIKDMYRGFKCNPM